MIQPQEFVKMFGNKPQEKIVQFAKVSPEYTSGRPSLIFDGETVVSGKGYPYLESYTPAAGDRVMVVKGVVIGKII